MSLRTLGCATGSAALPVVSPVHTYIAGARKMPVARCLSVLGETPAKVAGGTQVPCRMLGDIRQFER